MDAPGDSTDCRECGASGVGGVEGCKRLFEEVVGREFSRPELFRVHRLTVDAYSLQHPDPYMKSAKSAAAHLAGMCWSLEFGGGPEVSRALSRWLDGAPDLPTIAPPAGCERGAITVRDVDEAADSAEHIRRVEAWAEAAWHAWSEHHAQARAWVEQASGRRAEP